MGTLFNARKSRNDTKYLGSASVYIFLAQVLSGKWNQVLTRKGSIRKMFTEPCYYWWLKTTVCLDHWQPHRSKSTYNLYGRDYLHIPGLQEEVLAASRWAQLDCFWKFLDELNGIWSHFSRVEEACILLWEEHQRTRFPSFSTTGTKSAS